jgi:DNA-binding transcriptional regulator YiaG
MPRKQPIRDVLDRINDGTTGIDSANLDDESTTAQSADRTDNTDDPDDDQHVIDDHDRWRLTVDKSVVNAIGPEYCCPAFYTTGSPSCLRAWGGEFELSVSEVISAYIERSETEKQKSQLHNDVTEAVEEYTNTETDTDAETDTDTDSAMESYKDEETLRELYADGLSQAQIAHRLDCSVHQVSRWMDEHGILVGESSEHYSRHGKLVGDKRTDPDDAPNDTRYRDEQTLRQLYNDGLSLQQIADQLNQPPHVIYYWLDDYGIPEGKDEK